MAIGSNNIRMQNAGVGDAAGARMRARNEPAQEEDDTFGGQARKIASSLCNTVRSNSASCLVGAAAGVAVAATSTGGFAGFTSQVSRQMQHAGPANPSPVLDAYIRNGTFGTLKSDQSRIDGVVLSRGVDASRVFRDPHNEGAGLMLCNRAMKLFNQRSAEPQYQSEAGRFALAMESAIQVRQSFLATPETGRLGQNDLASYHAAQSDAVPGGSPYLSLTLNDPFAAYFGAGGDHISKAVEPNQNGKVFKGAVNNESTIFPVVGGKTKGIKIGYDPQRMADRGMKLTDELKVPFGELIIVGGFYFNDEAELEDAFAQNPEEFRSVSDLSGMSTQMFEPDRKAGVKYFDFRHQAGRIERQQGIDLHNLPDRKPEAPGRK